MHCCRLYSALQSLVCADRLLPKAAGSRQLSGSFEVCADAISPRLPMWRVCEAGHSTAGQRRLRVRDRLWGVGYIWNRGAARKSVGVVLAAPQDASAAEEELRRCPGGCEGGRAGLRKWRLRRCCQTKRCRYLSIGASGSFQPFLF